MRDNLLLPMAWGTVRLFSWLPFRVVYVFSDIMAFLLHRIVRYRLGVVRSNLSSSFPSKPVSELREIEKDFYHWLCDYCVETLKLASMSPERIERHMRFEGADEVAAELRAGKSVSLFLGHYCNWEWVSSLPLHFPADAMCAQIYHPLENKVSNALFLRLRSRFGALSVSMKDTLRVLLTWHRKGWASVTGYIADQVPGYAGTHFWADFLHHDTPVYSGGERMARKLKTSAWYIDMSRPRRSYYVGRFVRLAYDASELPEYLLTERYFRHLEATIRRAPQYWLWSHRRWKRTREEYERLFPDRHPADSAMLRRAGLE